MHPTAYPLPWKTLITLVLAAVRHRPLSFHSQSVASTARLKPPLRVEGKEHIPAQGPFLLTVNHYTRPGLPAWWHVLAVSAQVNCEVHWIMTAAWTCPGRPYARLVRWATQKAFQRVATVYGFTTMPPMPPDPSETDRRAKAVRKVLAYVHKNPEAVIGLAPEGRDFPGGVLGSPPSGVGRFILHLAGSGLPLLPVGVYEDSGSLCVRFGPVYSLVMQREVPTGERDAIAIEIVMRAIAVLLPPQLRGMYG